MNIFVFVNTEYHLLVAVNEILLKYADDDRYIVKLFIRTGARLSKHLDFSHLPVDVIYVDVDLSIEYALNKKQYLEIERLKYREIKVDHVLFFQEQDMLMLILIPYYSRTGAKISLYQDGLKPYVELRYPSLEMMKNNFLKNIWLYKNGYKDIDWWSPLKSSKYAYLPWIDSVHLTFPKGYKVRKRIDIEKIDFLPRKELSSLLQRVFCWKNDLVQKKGVILYLNQPFRYNGVSEIDFLEQVRLKFPDAPIYIKLHPLAKSEEMKKKYSQIGNVTLIESNVPAELYILFLEDSIILSISSTALLLDNPKNNFYYAYKIFKDQILMISRYDYGDMPDSHIRTIDTVDELYFSNIGDDGL